MESDAEYEDLVRRLKAQGFAEPRFGDLTRHWVFEPLSPAGETRYTPGGTNLEAVRGFVAQLEAKPAGEEPVRRRWSRWVRGGG